MTPRRKVAWGVLGASRFALQKAIPGMQKGVDTHVLALASRTREKARAACLSAGIERFHDSYEALLADPDVTIVYNPLPNHLHVPWSIAAMRAGKHVLCEKPIALSAEEARSLVAAHAETGRHVVEAFMIRHHPQWIETRDMLRKGAIGDVRAILCALSYFNDDPTNVRNQRDIGGGGLYDIGCYAVNSARFLLGREPSRVCALGERDRKTGIDRLTSGLLDFGSAHVTFTVGTQQVPFQTIQILGSTGRIEIEIPFNAPPDRNTHVFLDDGRDLVGGGRRAISIPAVDQYTLQADAFSRLVRDGGLPESPIEDSIGNLRVTDALFRSMESGRFESP